ncbi:MAG: surface antigen [Flavipsychrobacter sp.]|nr:surface antigen [Flavipsychrobacter sp.]
MSNSIYSHHKRILYTLLAGLICLSLSCNTTKYLKKDEHLLVKNKVTLKSDKPIPNKGERKDNLSKIIIQKPNSDAVDILPFKTPFKLWHYNHRYEKRHKHDSLLPKSVERPAILDTTLIPRSIQNMKNYLFNQGYFYASIQDTVIYSYKKAVVKYDISAGNNYLINKINYDVNDSNILFLLQATKDVSVLQKEKQFTYSMLEDERSRITSVMRNNGYYKFTQENVTFTIDTFDKTLFRNIESPFESAINFIKLAKHKTTPTIDINTIIRLADDTAAYKQFTIASVNVYPDFEDAEDLKDSTMIKRTIDSINFKYHHEYVHAKVLYEHIYIAPGNVYSQADYDKTYTKLNELGIFQYVRIDARENRKNRGTIDYNIYLTQSKKHDLNFNVETSKGSTYSLGTSVGANFRDKNFAHGANLLTIGVSGGLEWVYNENKGTKILDHFDLLTKFYGINASLDFPKFLAPVASSLFDNSNLPHTIIGGGENVLDRVNYFTLVNTSANFAYSWHQNQSITWTFAPAFINIIRLPVETDSFKKVLSTNAYLKNSYKPNFIEGQNISFTYDNSIKKHGINYSFLKLGLEEAGALLGAVNELGFALNDLYNLQFAQYAKFDFDARHYFTFPRSVFALHFYGGVGVPYDKSPTLPYIKQYFAGGPYSLRGWPIRTLGPGSYFNDSVKINQIDRTGDIKLEFNGEYRFPIAPLFAGAVKMNGAFFADMGNIWLAKADSSYPGGEFRLKTFGQTLAADMGIGLRFDIASFLTVRLDIGVPVKKPYVHQNGGWVFDKLDFYNSAWRKDNVIPVVTIGYPF